MTTKASMVEGEAPAAKKRRGRRVKVQGVFHASSARHRMAWGTEKGPQTEKEKQAAKRLEVEQRAAADLIAQTAQALERDYGVSSPVRDSRLKQRLKVEATSAKGALRFRTAVDGVRGTRVLGYYDGTPWLLVRDEEERREFFYNPGTREATWEEPPELQAEKHTGSTDGERASAASRAITSITRSMQGRTKRRRQILAAYAKCVKRLSGGYPDYVNRRLCFVEDIITASMTGLVAVLAYMRSEGVANIWVGAGVQTSRERHGDDWHGGSDAIRGSAGIPVDLILLILTCGSKVLLCLGPQDGGAQAVAQMCCNVEFDPLYAQHTIFTPLPCDSSSGVAPFFSSLFVIQLIMCAILRPGHARQLQQLFQAIAFCALSVLSLGLPFFCFVWTFSFSLWLLIAGFFKFDPMWIVAGYAAEKEVAWLTSPPRFCKPLARNLASIQYGFGGATLVWAGVDGESGILRPPTRTSIRCRCLHRRAADAAEKYQHGGLPMPGLGESDSDVDADVEAAGEPQQIQDASSGEDEGTGADGDDLLVNNAHSGSADDSSGGHTTLPDVGGATNSSVDALLSAPPGASIGIETSAETEAEVSDIRN